MEYFFQVEVGRKKTLPGFRDFLLRVSGIFQDRYETEHDAKENISRMITDYNFKRPNAGNGGFAPNEVHVHRIGGRWTANRRRH